MDVIATNTNKCVEKVIGYAENKAIKAIEKEYPRMGKILQTAKETRDSAKTLIKH